MDSSQDPSSRHLHSYNLDKNPNPRSSDTVVTTFASTDFTKSTSTDLPSSSQRQNKHQATEDPRIPVSSVETMALLLPPGPSTVAAQLPFTVAAQAASLAFAGFESYPSGLVGRGSVDATSFNVNAPGGSSKQSMDFGPIGVDSFDSAVRESWKPTSTLPTPTAASSLGLFFPAGDQHSEASPTVGSELQLHQQSIKPAMAIPPSLSSSFSSLYRPVQNLAEGHPLGGISKFSEFQVQSLAAPMPPAMPTMVKPAQQQMLAYRKSLTDAHTERLGGLLGLQHPLPPGIELQKQEGSSLVPDPDHQPALYGLQNIHIGNSPINAASQAVQPTPLPALPRDVDDLIMIVDKEDNILWTSDSMQACAGMLSDFKEGITGQSGGSSGWNAEALGSQRIKVAFLLADGQAITWWQRACQEVRSMCTHDEQGSQREVRRIKRELVLRHRSQESDDKFVEMTIVTTRNSEAAKDGALMVRLRTASIPAIAAVSSQAMLGSLDSLSPFRSSPSQNRDSRQSLASEDAELRLLVSRTGLILRASTPRNYRSPPSHMASSQESGGARALFALLGEGVSMPSFGQSLVDVPRLAPLLHVIAQASVVGLAQTVKLKAGGRQITATVQPVLRSPTVDAEGSKRARPPAAKVWITLSAPSIVTRRSSSAMSQAMTGFGVTPPGLTALTQPATPQQRFVALDRRHSEQMIRQDSPYQASSWPPTSSIQAGNSPFTARSMPFAEVVQATSASQSPSLGRGKGKESSAQHAPQLSLHENPNSRIEDAIPVSDSLSALMAQLQEENRDLRREIEARRHRHQKQQAQSFTQPFAQPFAQPFTPPQWHHTPLHSLQTTPLPIPTQSPISIGDVPGSCPTKLVYLP